MNQLEAMQIFVRVADGASFTLAANDLGLSRSAVSATVQWLEGLVGTRLLHRTTRRVQMTQDGQLFYERCKDILSDMEEAEGMFRASPADLRGRLRVDMPIGVARDIVLPRLPEFMAAHPNVLVDLGSTDRLVDLVREGFDCVLRVGAVGDSSLIGRCLGVFRQINCASPDYLAAHGTPQTLADLRRHFLIHYSTVLGARSAGFEYRDAASGATRALPMAGKITVNNSIAYHGACLAGMGIIQVPDTGVHADVAGGRLVEIMPAFQAPPMPVTLLYGSRRHVPKRAQVFMAWLEEVLRPHLGPVAAAS